MAFDDPVQIVDLPQHFTTLFSETLLIGFSFDKAYLADYSEIQLCCVYARNTFGGAMTSGHEVARALRAAYLGLHRQTNDCFAKDDVTADQFVLLAALAEADAVTQQDLVRRVGSDPSTLRAMLLLLEGRGLVVRRRHPDDGRARCVMLTAKGRRIYQKLWKKSDPLRSQLMSAFRPDDVTALVGLLRRVAEVMAPPASNGSRIAAMPYSTASNSIEQ
jgi:DNA-binding MarR family transcriptional regulator